MLITVTLEARAAALIAQQASETTWLDLEARKAVIENCQKIQNACKKVGVEFQIQDGR